MNKRINRLLEGIRRELGEAEAFDDNTGKILIDLVNDFDTTEKKIKKALKQGDLSYWQNTVASIIGDVASIAGQVGDQALASKSMLFRSKLYEIPLPENASDMSRVFDGLGNVGKQAQKEARRGRWRYYFTAVATAVGHLAAALQSLGEINLYREVLDIRQGLFNLAARHKS